MSSPDDTPSPRCRCWCSPSQIARIGPHDEPVNATTSLDVWGFGLCLFELLMQGPLFESELGDHELLATLVDDKPVVIRGLADMNPVLATVLQNCLVKVLHCGRVEVPLATGAGSGASSNNEFFCILHSPSGASSVWTALWAGMY